MSEPFLLQEPVMSQRKPSMDYVMKQRAMQVKKPDIFEACINGKLATLMSFFPSTNTFHPTIDQLDTDKYSLLHYAVRYNHYDIVKFLISCNADVNIKGGKELHTPMHLAARYKACLTLQTQRKLPPEQLMKYKEYSSHPILMSKSQQNQPKFKKSEREYAYDSSGALMSYSSAEHVKVVEFIQSASSKCQNIIRLLYDSGANLNARDDNSSTPLHYAVMRRNVSAVLEILSIDNSSVCYKDIHWFTPLHYAAEQGSEIIARILIDQKADLEALNEFKMTPLHVACEEGHTEVADLLLKEYAKLSNRNIKEYINKKDINLYTPLHYAAISGVDTLMTLLLQFNPECLAKDNLNHNTPLHLACSAGNIENVIKLVNLDPNLMNEKNLNKETPLHIAAGLHRVDIVRFLIDRKVEINCMDKDMETPLFFAAKRDCVEIAKLLIENGADLWAKNTEECTVLHVAAVNNSTDCVDYFAKLENFDKLQNSWDSHENRPIHLSVRSDNIDMVELLCRYEAPLNAKNDRGFTPLLIAASQGHIDIIKFLLSVNSPLALDEDDANNNALHLAAENGFFTAIPILFEAGLATESRNIQQQTPLDVACVKGNLKVVQSLIECEARINVPEMSKFKPPLIIASRYGHSDIVSLLINRGADVRKVDENNKNCLEIAIEENRRDTVFAILNTSKWAEILRHVSIHNGHHTTPLRRMIEIMPDAAELVFDKCLTNNGLPKNHKEYKISCNYEFLEDIYTEWGSTLVEANHDYTLEKSNTIFHSLFKILHLYFERIKFKTRNRNHPLSLIVHKERSSLLGHPLVRYLVRHKWGRSPFYIYYIRLIFLIVTLIFFTGNCIVSASAPYKCIRSHAQPTQSPEVCEKGYDINLTGCLSCPFIPPENNMRSVFFVSFGKIIILLLTLCSIVILLFYITINIFNLISIQIIMELSSYILAFIYILGFFTWSDGSPVEPIRLYRCTNTFRSIGAISLCLMWLSFILFLGKIPKIGIYVVMYTDIFRTFLQFVPVYFMLVFSFAIPFYMLFLDRGEVNSYTTPIKAIFKTLIATVGEIEYDTFYNTSAEPPLGIAYFVLFLFVLANSIILMNLLVGLAVDDIQGVQSQAFLKRVGLQVKSAMELETFVPLKYSKDYIKLSEEFCPNYKKKPYIWSWWVFKSNPFVDSSNDSESITENLTKTFRDVKDSIRSLKHQIRALNDRNQKIETMLEELLRRQSD